MSELENTARASAASLEAQYEGPFTLDVRFEECCIRVRTNSQPLRDELAKYHSHWRDEFQAPDIEVLACEGAPIEVDQKWRVCERPPGKRGNNEEYVDLPDGRLIRKRRTGMTFLVGENENVAVGPCRDNIQQIVNFIDNCYMEWLLKRGGELLHAAGVAGGHQGVALAGASGMGKSTLALRLIEHGLDLISNDRLILDARLPGLRVYGVAKHPRVNPGTLLHNPTLSSILPQSRRKELSDLPLNDLWAREEKHDVDINAHFGPGRHGLIARLSGVVVINWQHTNDPPSIAPVDILERDDLVRVIAKTRGVFAPGPVQIEVSQIERARLARMLSECPTYEITGGVNFDVATDFCRDVVSSLPQSTVCC